MQRSRSVQKGERTLGMFDQVLCNHDLFGEHKGETHQTKDLRSFLDDYEITPAGRLEFLEYRIEDRSDPNATGALKLIGSLTRIFTGKRQDLKYEGWLHLSAFGRARFVDGTIVAFELEPYDESDEETVELAPWVARRRLRQSIPGSLEKNWRVREPRGHMTVRDLSEELKNLDPNSEVSVIIPDLQDANACGVFIVDEHGKGIEIKLTVEAVKQANPVQSQSRVIDSDINIRGGVEAKGGSDPNSPEDYQGGRAQEQGENERDRRSDDEDG
jgi:hypothetical protein